MEETSVEGVRVALILPVLEALFNAEIGDAKRPDTGTLRAEASRLLPRAALTLKSKKCEIQVRLHSTSLPNIMICLLELSPVFVYVMCRSRF